VRRPPRMTEWRLAQRRHISMTMGKLPNKDMRTGMGDHALKTSAIERLCAHINTYPSLRTKVNRGGNCFSGNILAVSGSMAFGPRHGEGPLDSPDPRDPDMNAKVNNAVNIPGVGGGVCSFLKRKQAGDYLERAMDSQLMMLTAQVAPGKTAA